MIHEGYKLIQRIGAGTFGEVWRAEAPGGVEVAIKIIFRPISDQEVKRELAALDLLKRLRHPYLLQTQAYWLADERLHIAMELGDCSLRDRVREAQKTGEAGIPLDELLRYFHESAEALDFLHSERVLHRDVKPENILLMKRHAKVADFGLARLLQPDRASVSASGAGTPRYMAPEVWHNRVNPASDQYSLALTYLELRLGRHLKEGGNMMDWMFFHLQETPDLSAFGHDEREVLLRALSKEPTNRFPSCTAMAEELATAAKHSPLVAPRLVPDHGSVAVAEAAAIEDFGTIAPVGRTFRDLMPAPQTPPSAMETIAATPNTSVAESFAPVVSKPWNQSKAKPRIWLAGILLGLTAATTLSVWWFLHTNTPPNPRPTSPQVLGPTTKEPTTSKTVGAEPFRLSSPQPLTLRVGQKEPSIIRMPHTRAPEPVELTFTQVPAGVKLTQIAGTAGDGGVTVSASASRQAAVGAHRVGIAARTGEDRQDLEWDIRIEPYLPLHAQAAPNAAIVKDSDGQVHYSSILVTAPSGTPVEFVLVPRKQASDLPTFYIMKDKVSVEQYRHFAALHPESVSDSAWTKGGRADGKDTSNNNSQHPVLRVKVADALNFARWLGGNLPTAQQWDQAAGRHEKEPGEGPFRGTWKPDDTQVAVNRAKEGPRPVGSSQHDVTWCGARDMAGNGREWTRSVAGAGDRLLPLEKPTEDDRVILRGRSYAASEPFRFADIESDLISGQFFGVTSHHTGFRVVIDLN
jgi:serine/threonine protein kinase